NTASASASDIAPDLHGPGKDHQERSAAPTRHWVEETRNSDSRCTFFLAGVAVELAKQSVTILLGPVREVRNKVFDLVACGFAEGFGAAEIDSVGLDEVGIQLVLADELAETVADLGAAVVPVGRLYGNLLPLRWGLPLF